MNTNPDLHDKLVAEAEAAFLALTTQVDHIYDSIDFYLERHPLESISDARKSLEIYSTLDNLSQLIPRLADIISCWKRGIPLSMSKLDVEQDIIIEIWVNLQAFIYFLISHDVALEPFNLVKASAAFFSLLRCNRLLG